MSNFTGLFLLLRAQLTASVHVIAGNLVVNEPNGRPNHSTVYWCVSNASQILVELTLEEPLYLTMSY